MLKGKLTCLGLAFLLFLSYMPANAFYEKYGEWKFDNRANLRYVVGLDDFVFEAAVEEVEPAFEMLEEAEVEEIIEEVLIEEPEVLVEEIEPELEVLEEFIEDIDDIEEPEVLVEEIPELDFEEEFVDEVPVIEMEIEIPEIDITLDETLIDIMERCMNAEAAIHSILSSYQTLLFDLQNKLMELDNELALMREAKSKANRANNRLQNCFGLMTRTTVCSPPEAAGYNPADWAADNPAAEMADLDPAYNAALAKRADLLSKIADTESKISDIEALLAPGCYSEADIANLNSQILVLEVDYIVFANDVVALTADVDSKIADFWTEYNEAKNKILDFLAKVDAIVNAHLPIRAQWIRAACGTSMAAARAEARRRANVVRCLRRANRLASQMI